MKQSEKMGYVLGALTVGAVAGILLAPKSGKETRTDLKHKMKALEKDSPKILEAMHLFVLKVVSKIKEEFIHNIKDSNGRANLN